MSASTPRPPGFLTHLLALWRLGPRRREVEEDLAELFAERAAAHGAAYAGRRYLVDVLSVGWRWWQDRRSPRTVAWRMPTGIVQDVVFAARLFRRQPAIVAMIIAGLALAIGVTTAVLTMVQRTVFPDTGIAAPDRVFRIEGRPWPYPDYLHLREFARSVTAFATAWGVSLPEFRAEADADRGNLPTLRTLRVTGNYFDVLGARPAFGRLLTPADDDAGAPMAIVLSHRAWTTMLGADPEIVGRTVWLGPTAYTLVGVADRSFAPPDNDRAVAWTNVAAQRDLRVFVRLRPGVSQSHAEAELDGIATTIRASRGQVPAPNGPAAALRAITELESTSRRMIILVAVPAALLVVLACANVAHLLLAAAVERRREIGTRLALGASRGRVARQVLTESLAVGAVGGAAGLVLASWLVPWLASLLTSSAPEDPSPNLVVYAAAALFTVLVAMAAGLAPARLAWRSDVTSAVKTDRLGAPGGLSGGRLRAVLVGAQATASIVLLVVSALFVRSFLHVSGYAHGAHVDRLLNVTITFGRSDEAERATLLRAASDRIGRLAGVSSVSRATFPPFSDGAAVTGVARGLPNAQPVYRNFVDADYFDTISARVLQGRTFGPDEVSGEAPVAVITSALARAFWPAGDPIGSDLRRLWGDDDAADGSRTSWNRKPAGTRIVGVVEETTARLRTIGQATIYLPVSREVEALERLVVRAGSDVSPSFLVGPIHAALRALDPELSRHVEVVGARLSEELWPLQSRATVAGTVGASGLALAVMGLFAMTAYAVAQRRHELSVRVALGATGPQVVRMILRRSLTPVAIGLACGLGASVFADRLVRSWLIDIQPHDPFAIGAAVSILLVAALAAAFIPARHAARVDPVEMLRQS